MSTERFGSATYCAASTKGRAGMFPRATAASADAISSNVPPTCTVPARWLGSWVHGTPPSTAMSRLRNGDETCRSEGGVVRRDEAEVHALVLSTRGADDSAGSN